MTSHSLTLLVRYGAIPEVGRFAGAPESVAARGDFVVIRTHRGEELGTVLEAVRPAAPTRNGSPPPAVNGHGGDDGGQERASDDPPSAGVLRRATAVDRERYEALRGEAQAAFGQWQDRIRRWGLELELIDLEWTLDRARLTLYVLGGRGADSTKLALFAAAEGLHALEVQPVTAEGLVALPAGGGCGAGGCGCH